MRRITWIAALVVGFALVLSGCGAKSEGAIVKKLSQAVNKTQSYQADGTMTVQTGQQPQVYNVQVWYQPPNFYRIALNNKQQNTSQIVLRNNEGVFVLTPQLNKSFRFKSDWPDNQGQVYLFKSLAQSILDDTARQMTTDNGAYVFDVAANYQNSALLRQRIWLDPKTYTPRHVEVSDGNGNVKVIVDFSSFVFNAKFDNDSFDMQRNMKTSAVPDNASPTVVDTVGTVQNGTTDANSDTSGMTPTVKGSGSDDVTFGVVDPYIPNGVKQQDMEEITVDGQKAILQRFEGVYNYILEELEPRGQDATSLNGQIIDLGYTLGVMVGDENKSLEWIYNNTEFRLTSANLPEDEMIQVAMSIDGQSGK